MPPIQAILPPLEAELKLAWLEVALPKARLLDDLHNKNQELMKQIDICQLCTIFAGATIGSFTVGTLADKFGRTKTFQLDAIPLAVGAFLCATSQSVQTLILPIYSLELELASPLLLCHYTYLRWRTMFGIAIIPSVLLALGMAFSPESPRWLYQQGKFSQAQMPIKGLFGKQSVAEVMNDFGAVKGPQNHKLGWIDLFSNRYQKGIPGKEGKLFILDNMQSHAECALQNL